MLRQVEGQILVFFHHQHTVAGIIGSDVSLFILHSSVDLVHHILLHQWALLCQKICAILQDFRICGIEVNILIVPHIPQQQLRNTKSIPGIVDHQDLAGILFIPHQFPACNIRLIHILGIVQNAQRAPGVGNRVLVLRIVIRILKLLIYISIKIGNIVEVQLQQHILRDHPIDHVIRRNDHIHGNTACSQFGIQNLVGFIFRHPHINIGIPFFKLRNQIHGAVSAVSHIHAPVVDIQGDLLLAVAKNQEAAAQQQTRCHSTGNAPAGNDPTLGSRPLVHFLLVRTQLKQIHGQHQYEDQAEQQGKHSVYLGMDGLFGVSVDLNRQRYEIGAGNKIADDKVIQTHGKCHDAAGNDAGQDLMQGYLKEGPHRSAAQVHCRIGQRRIHLLQLGHDIQKHIGQSEGHMGDQQCPEIQRFPSSQKSGTHKDKQQAQRNTGDDVGVGHGDIGHAHDHFAHFGFQAVDAHRCHSAQANGNSCGQKRDQHRVAQKSQKLFIPEKLCVLAEGKAFKLGDVFSCIERCHDQHRHGNIQENKDQDG